MVAGVLMSHATGTTIDMDELRSPDVAGLTITDQELEALQFLYAYMPLADVTDYTVH